MLSPPMTSRPPTCRPSPLPRPVQQRSKLPGPGLAPGGEPHSLGTSDRRALPARGPPHTRRCRPAGRHPLAPASPGDGEQIADVLGILEENDSTSFAVRTCDGALVVIPAARALAGKVVPPAPQNRRRAAPLLSDSAAVAHTTNGVPRACRTSRRGTATGFGQGIPPPRCAWPSRIPTPRRRLWRASAARHPLAARAVEGRGVARDAGGRGARDMLAITPASRSAGRRLG